MIFSQDNLTDIIQNAPDSVSQAVKKDWSALEAISVDDLINRIAATVVDFAIHLAVAILVFYAGKFIIRKIYGLTSNILTHRHVDKSLSTFVLSLVNMLLFFILIVTVIGIIGINTSSFIAIFASAGVAIGMALSGTLQNFAGGVLILLLKPYRVGDYIEAQGYAGVVKEIQIFSTIIVTPDNKSIIVPNGPLSTGSINNWSREEYRRIDWTIGISYGDDVEKARQVILDMLTADERVVRGSLSNRGPQPAVQNTTPYEPVKPHRSWWRRILGIKASKKSRDLADSINEAAENLSALPAIDCTPKVFLSELADSSVNLSVRAWVKSSDYWGVYFSMNEKIYTTLPAFGINFPFPQMDVHIAKDA